MLNLKYAHDPLTGLVMQVFNESNKQWGVARNKSSGHDFLTENYTWIVGKKTGMHLLPTQEEGCKFANNYVEAMIKKSIIPLGFDIARMRFAVKCPHCRMTHKGELANSNWGATAMTPILTCPKTQDAFQIRIWEPIDPKFIKKVSSLRKPVAPDMDLSRLPVWNCSECFGTGEFVGFNQIEPCSTCLPKQV